MFSTQRLNAVYLRCDVPCTYMALDQHNFSYLIQNQAARGSVAWDPTSELTFGFGAFFVFPIAHFFTCETGSNAEGVACMYHP